jgi:hypothetical protein
VQLARVKLKILRGLLCFGFFFSPSSPSSSSRTTSCMWSMSGNDHAFFAVILLSAAIFSVLL